MRAILLALALLPAPLLAQARDCPIPAVLAPPRPDLPSAKEPVRILPIGGYTLAIGWSPEHCRTHPADAFQCGRPGRFGFVLHGLWPDGEGADWPQYCAPTPLVDPATIRRALCATPSVQLVQHEWAKHGTCMPGFTPRRYFALSNALYRRLRFPDMARLSHRPLTAGAFATIFAAANPGLRADMMRVTVTRDGWLDEVWLCRDTRLRPVRCPAGGGGARPATPLRIRQR